MKSLTNLSKKINASQDIKLGKFREDEFDVVRKKIINRKAAGLHDILRKFGREENLKIYYSDYARHRINKTLPRNG